MKRLTIKQTGATKFAFSPIKQRMVVYSKCQALATGEHFEYDLITLKNDYNSELASQSIDAYVEGCKKIRTTFQDNVSIDLWVAGESPLDPVTIGLLIALIIVGMMAICTVLSATAAFVERVFPKIHFYTPDGKVFDTLAEYITYMGNVYNPAHGKPYSCGYCGQGFATAEERDEHEANCPWKGGVPQPEINWLGALTALVIVGVIGVGVIIIVPKVLK